MLYNLIGLVIIFLTVSLTSWPLLVSIPVGVLIAAVMALAIGYIKGRWAPWLRLYGL